MRRILSLVVLAVLVPLLQAQEKQAAVRICVATLENTSRHIVNPAWERNQLVRALERTNKSKEVKKGKAPKIETVALDSSGEADTTVREKNCDFVLYTNLTEVLQGDRPEVSVPPPGAVQVGTGVGDSRAYPPDYHSATVNYRLVRVGNFKPWAEGMVNGDAQLSEDMLVSQLMDQIANRVVVEIRKPHDSGPE
ncbi:MAG TPA: hypothetical protein VJ756_12820 [Terriglobales bacterium]|nr:hypothetical protein [Terriglobales bacterium]